LIEVFESMRIAVRKISHALEFYFKHPMPTLSVRSFSVLTAILKECESSEAFREREFAFSISENSYKNAKAKS
jgi:hypothetical protein